MNNKIKLGKYKHYKGNEYELIGIGKHTENLKEYAIYKALNGNENDNKKIWIRPLDMFFEEVIINGISMPRFELIS
ncbi:MAG: DUF1653 domain-containing protein [Candidatus Absconditabacteria bacterium]